MKICFLSFSDLYFLSSFDPLPVITLNFPPSFPPSLLP